MRQKITVAILFLFLSIALARIVRVKGGLTKSGIYRTSHLKTSPNRTKIDNWSTKGNTNPLTGKKGTADPYKIKLK